MGTDLSGEGNSGRIIPQVMDTIFRKVDTAKDGSEFLLKSVFY
jgi:kinesin family protein 4/21/27